MSDTPKPAVADPKAAERLAAIQAWHDCKTDADRKACVTKHPILAELYSLAATLK